MWPLLIVLTFQSPPTRHVILHEAERVHAAELASTRATAFVGGAAELTSRRAGTKLAFDAHHVGADPERCTGELAETELQLGGRGELQRQPAEKKSQRSSVACCGFEEWLETG